MLLGITRLEKLIRIWIRIHILKSIFVLHILIILIFLQFQPKDLIKNQSLETCGSGTRPALNRAYLLTLLFWFCSSLETFGSTTGEPQSGSQAGLKNQQIQTKKSHFYQNC